jgi:hypothetical protein
MTADMFCSCGGSAVCWLCAAGPVHRVVQNAQSARTSTRDGLQGMPDVMNTSRTCDSGNLAGLAALQGSHLQAAWCLLAVVSISACTGLVMHQCQCSKHGLQDLSDVLNMSHHV